MLDKLAMNTWNRVSAQEVASALGSPAVRVQRTKYHDAVYTFDRPGAAKTSPILTLHTEPVRLSIENMILVPASLMTICWAVFQQTQLGTNPFINSANCSFIWPIWQRALRLHAI